MKKVIFCMFFCLVVSFFTGCEKVGNPLGEKEYSGDPPRLAALWDSPSLSGFESGGEDAIFLDVENVFNNPDQISGLNQPWVMFNPAELSSDSSELARRPWQASIKAEVDSLHPEWLLPTGWLDLTQSECVTWLAERYMRQVFLPHPEIAGAVVLNAGGDFIETLRLSGIKVVSNNTITCDGRVFEINSGTNYQPLINQYLRQPNNGANSVIIAPRIERSGESYDSQLLDFLYLLSCLGDGLFCSNNEYYDPSEFALGDPIGPAEEMRGLPGCYARWYKSGGFNVYIMVDCENQTAEVVR